MAESTLPLDLPGCASQPLLYRKNKHVQKSLYILCLTYFIEYLL